MLEPCTKARGSLGAPWVCLGPSWRLLAPSWRRLGLAGACFERTGVAHARAIPRVGGTGQGEAQKPRRAEEAEGRVEQGTQHGYPMDVPIRISIDMFPTPSFFFV